MANEATINASLQIVTDELEYQSRPQQFRANVTGRKGPVPGAFTVAVTGTNVDFSELVTPGYAIIKNLDDTNFVEYGIWDGLEFYPLGEILPGEHYPLRLSRNLGKSVGTGTGTVGTGTYTLRFKADTAPVDVSVEAFET